MAFLLNHWQSTHLPPMGFQIQNQPFVDVLQNRYFWKFCNFHRKTSVLDCLFDKVSGAFRPLPFLKTDSNTGVFLQILQNFYKHLFLYNTSGGCFSKSESHRVISLTHLVFLGMSAIISWKCLVYPLLLPRNTCGANLYRTLPHGVSRIVRWQSPWQIRTK